MDCSHLPPSDPTADPNPNPNPNPHLHPQSHNTHFVSGNAYQWYTTSADSNIIMFLPQIESQQPIIHSPYTPPPASAVYVPLHFVSSDSYAAASYYTDPSANGTSAAGHYVPGLLNYSAVNGVATPAANLHQNTTNQIKGTKKKKKKAKLPVPHAWCDVCKIDCTSKDVLDLHRLGKKHKKNLEKLKSISIGPIIAYHPPLPLSVPSPAVVTHLPPIIATSTPIVEPHVSSPMIAASSPSTDEPIIGPQVPLPTAIAPSPPKIATSNPLPISDSTSPKDEPIIGPQAQPTRFAPSPLKITTSNPLPVSDSTSPRDEPIIGPQAPPTGFAPSPLKIATSAPLPVSDSTSPGDEPIIGPQAPLTIAPSPPKTVTSDPLPVSDSTSPGDRPITGPQAPPTGFVPSPPKIVTSNPLPVSDSTSPGDKPIIGPQAPPTGFAPSLLKIATSNPLPVSDSTSPGDEPIIGPQAPPTVIALSSMPLFVSTSASTDQPTIGPQVEKVRVSSCKSSKKRGKTASIEEFEMKRRKVLESGTSAEDVHVCNVCNVVCNSETVLKSHLAGRKHVSAAAAMKKLASTGVATTT